jgi:hypothetical protein
MLRITARHMQSARRKFGHTGLNLKENCKGFKGYKWITWREYANNNRFFSVMPEKRKDEDENTTTIISGEEKITESKVTDSKKKNMTPKGSATSRSKALSTITSVTQTVVGGTVHFVKQPITTSRELWGMFKETCQHYYIGSKLLWAEIKLARSIVSRLVTGHSMTRRERMQLIRTTLDIFRVVPLTIFLVVPLLEFLLPVALKIFPNMLPSTFQDNLKKEEQMKKELKLRLDMADFMQETLKTMAKKKKNPNVGEDEKCSATEILQFIDSARNGAIMPNDQVLKMARFFEDELTLANVSRPQLVSMCKYMGLPPYGGDAFLRFQLRAKLRNIKEDDRSILWEGIDSLTIPEIREACQDRGMRATGLSNYAYKKQLEDWLDLSMQKSVPIALLVLSRAFSIQHAITLDTETDSIKTSISSMDEEVLNEVVLAAARNEEENTVDIKKRKLESIQFQNEMIQEELDDKKARQELEQGKEGKKLEIDKSANEDEAAPYGSPKDDDDDMVDTSKSRAVDPNAVGPGDLMKEVDEDSVESEEMKELSISELEALGDLVRGSTMDREKSKLNEIKATIGQSSLETAKEALQKAISDNIEEQKVDKTVTVEDTKPEKMNISIRDEMMNDTSGAVEEEPIDPTSHEEISTTDKVAESNIDVKEGEVDKEEEEEEEVEDKNLKNLRDMMEKMVNKIEEDIEKTEIELGDSFQILDLDGDGELSVDELRAGLEVLKTHLSDVEAEALISSIDEDGDGKIRVEELWAYIQMTKQKVKDKKRAATSASSGNNKD